jgi:hypothetical protein
MVVNSVQLCEDGGCTPSPFTLSTITSKAVVYAPAERAHTLISSLIYPFLLCGFSYSAIGLIDFMQEFDIGLVHLNSPLSFNDYVQVLYLRCAKYTVQIICIKRENEDEYGFCCREIGINCPSS